MADITIPDMPEYPREQLLGFERDLLGLYISDHPLQAFAARFERDKALKVCDLAEIPDRTEILVGGIITSIKPFTSKKSGEPMAFFNLEDMTGTVACTMFPRDFSQQGHNLEKDKVVILRGRASHRERVRDDDDGGHIVEVLAEEIIPIANAGGNGPAAQKIMIKVESSNRDVLRYVRETIEMNRGNGGAVPVHIRIPDTNGQTEVKTELFAEYSEAFRSALEHLLGRQSVWVE